ncbi:MAG: type VI secretion system baseplate subunit TssE [Acidobacteriota bacterium]|nr:type VI secretion system baseplate subunit TssE [Acidobacteriota bacterium]
MTLARQSVLDRLLGPDPPTQARSIQKVKDSLKRDLEWMLNTRRNPKPVPDGLSELNNSLYVYGVPDISSLSLNSERDRNRLLLILDQTISALEPRLTNVRVTLDNSNARPRELRFVIHGLLLIDPSPEPVYFDTVLELNSGEYQIAGERHAR